MADGDDFSVPDRPAEAPRDDIDLKALEARDGIEDSEEEEDERGEAPDA